MYTMTPSLYLPALLFFYSIKAEAWTRAARISRYNARPISTGALQAARSNGFPKKRGPQQSKTSPKSDDKPIYSMPALYDLAFGYRSYEDEVTFLLQTHERCTGQTPANILEMAAGPARHALTALQLHDAVQSATCVDLSPEMAAYAKAIADEELPENRKNMFTYIVDDMRYFQLEDASQTFDTAWILLGSLQHLTKNEDVIACLTLVNRHLETGGTLIVELPHPRETFSMVECTRNGWEVPLEDENGEESGELRIVWGDEDDEFNSITQVRNFTVAMELTGVAETDKLQNVREVVPLRLFTAQEIDALARCAGFEMVEMYGSLDEEVKVDDEDLAFRLVSVLRKL
jgi:SAM-dependent methyltransferase